MNTRKSIRSGASEHERTKFCVTSDFTHIQRIFKTANPLFI